MGEGNKPEASKPFRELPPEDPLLAQGLFAKTAQTKQAAAEAMLRKIDADPRNWTEELKPEWQTMLDDLAAKKPPGYDRTAQRIQAEKTHYTRQRVPEAQNAVNVWRHRITQIQLAANGQLTPA